MSDFAHFERELIVPVSEFRAIREKHALLIIYGGSKNFSRRLINQYFAKEFPAHDITVFTFDFRGMFENSVPFCETGLHTRIEDASEVVELVLQDRKPSNISILGISMGGYIAVHLTKYNPKNLILVAPAAYDKNIIENQINFKDPERNFTNAIRKTNSWHNSDVFPILRDYNGSLLIVRFENDEIVPDRILLSMFCAANTGQTRDNSLITLKEYNHGKMFCPPNTKKQKKITNTVINWMLDNRV